MIVNLWLDWKGVQVVVIVSLKLALECEKETLKMYLCTTLTFLAVFGQLSIFWMLSSADDDVSSSTPEILTDFFAEHGIQVNANDPKFLNRYKPELVEKMAEAALSKKFEDSYRLNGDVAKMIYKIEHDKSPDDENEALMNALDLLVPDSLTDDIYAKAKTDLRSFYKENRRLSKELIERLTPIREGDLHTEGAAKLLRHFYYHWIPLGRLVEFIEKNAT